MASPAVLYGECDSEVTRPAEFAFKNIFHEKMLCCLLFHVENVRMAVRAIQPFIMFLVRENGRLDKLPFSLKGQELIEFYGFIIFFP